ncbi:MAG: porin [Hyphomicrobium aestuarii]|nr:porin [Hyphomicrobium aestuarii]
MKYLSLSALIAAGALASSVSMANAADLGGNCCADLEERIAELEVTTARKGNRKVSLTVSGWVAEQVIAWDDGVETNVYQTGVGGTLDSNFRFTGSAKISPDLSAGFVLHIEASSAANLAVNQRQDDPAGAGLSILQSFWFLKSESLGRLSVGQQSSAYDNVAVLPDGSGSLIQANFIMYDVNGFFVRRNGVLSNTVNWGSLATCGSQAETANAGAGLAADCDGAPNNNVRYDTPTFMGFSASASWGEDDVWGVAGRYAGEFSGFKLAAAVGYYENSDDNGNPLVVLRGGKDSAAFQAGAYIQHIPTGLFVYGAYGRDFNDVTGATFGGGGLTGQQQIDGDNYYVKAGIRQKFTPYGATVLFGEYGQNNDKMSNALWSAGVNSSNLEQYGLGLVQEIDAAAMSLFVVYRHYEGDVNCRGNANRCGTEGLALGNNSFDEHQLVKMGAIINF